MGVSYLVEPNSACRYVTPPVSGAGRPSGQRVLSGATMDSKTSNLELEVFVLRTASILTVLYAIVGIAIATICDSMTLIVDALYSVVDVIVSLLAIFIVRMWRGVS